MPGIRSWMVGLLLVSPPAYGQENTVAVVLRGNFTTGSELFPDAESADPVARAHSFTLNSIPGVGLEIRYTLPRTNVAVGLSADYLRAGNSLQIPGLPSSVPAEDGFLVIPVELTGYFLLPFSGSSFGVYMGGGVGGYFGRRIYRIADVEAQPLSQGQGFGIHVLGGVLFRISGILALLGEMKFRDVQFESTTAFPLSQTIYNGIPVTLDREPQVSIVHVDGIVFQIGIALSW